MGLQFEYSAIGLFRDDGHGRTELRVIVLDVSDRDIALERAEQMMEAYARDFGLKFLNLLNVFEAGTDMIGEYGEIFSVTWRSDPDFENRLIQKLEEEA